MSLAHTFVSAKTDGGDATQVQPSNWNAEHIVDANGLKFTDGTAAPSAPASGFTLLFTKTLAAAPLPAMIGASGADLLLQPFIGQRKVGFWVTAGNSTTGAINFGMTPPTNQGTLTARNVASTSLFTSMRRQGGVSATSAGSFTGWRAAAFQFMRGDAAGKGGFRFVCRFGCSDAATVAGARTFVGLAAASVGAVDPSSAANIIGVGTDAGDANLSIMHNDASGTATKVALGANFPDHTLSADAYELALFCPPNASTVTWEITRLGTAFSDRGTISTDLPAATALLGPQVMRNNGATALAVGIDLVSLYIETEN